MDVDRGGVALDQEGVLELELQGALGGGGERGLGGEEEDVGAVGEVGVRWGEAEGVDLGEEGLLLVGDDVQLVLVDLGL